MRVLGGSFLMGEVPLYTLNPEVFAVGEAEGGDRRSRQDAGARAGGLLVPPDELCRHRELGDCLMWARF